MDGKHGSVMVWGYFGGGRSRDSRDREKEHRLTSQHSICIIGQNFILQEDNDPMHSSKLCRNYIQSNERKPFPRIMSCPSQSPNLSPIELLLKVSQFSQKKP